MKILFCIIAAFVCTSSEVSAQRQIQFPDSSELVFNKAMREINPKYSSWIRSVAPQVNEKNMNEADVKQMTTTQWSVLGNMNGQDIEGIAFLVLMQAAKSAQEDLKAIMAQVKTINERKKTLREASDKLNDKNPNISRVQLDSFKLLVNTIPAVQNVNTTMTQPDRTVKRDSSYSGRLKIATGPVSKAELDNTIETVKNKLDSMSEMGEMESLRLQMAMDRMSKMMSTLSNLLKKISDSAQSITQNLK